MNFYLLARWVLVLMLLYSFILIPVSFRWFKTYQGASGYIKKEVVIDSTEVLSDNARSPMITGYSKDLADKMIIIDDSRYFLSKEGDVYEIWDNPNNRYAYLVLPGEKEFPKKSFFFKLLLNYSLLILSIIWGVLSFRYYKNTKRKG